ncbi:sulfatase family protein [Draconibacterium mangrovi]|uniref:sulfatase family protein n=1 Tax=Draconibacterium mangrovi TaxID=2697469 RepID=UPI0013D65636|nr:sulfatase [Draconibacterium mangrovi]
MKFKIKNSWIIVCYTVGILLCGCSNPEPAKPNLVYIFPDQFRKQAMGFWEKPGYENAIRTIGDPVETPELDRFANEAVVLTNMVSNAPICSPHRGSLLTGMFPGASGVPLNCNSNRPVSSLRKDAVCFSDVLDQQGYNTAYFGKWHLDYPKPNDPINPGNYVDPRTPAWDAYTPEEDRHGFQHWYSYGTWDVHKDPHYYNNQGQRTEPKEWSPKHEANQVIAYLKNEKGQRDPEKPFAVFVSMNPPHNPYNSLNDCEEKDYNLYKDKLTKELLVRPNADLEMDKARKAAFYFANVTGVSREFGRIIDQLKNMGEYENTVIVFTSDHGETMCSHGINDPKNNIYTEAFDVPFLIRYPGLKAHRLDDLIMGSPDIMPTLLGVMGLQDFIPTEVQGTNYTRVLKGESDKNRPKSALYIRNIDGQKDSSGKVIDYFPVARGVKTHSYTIELQIDSNQKLVGTKFFNDIDDPYQMNNLPVKSDDPVVIGLLKEMVYWLKKSDDPWYQQKILSDWIDYKTDL